MLKKTWIYFFPLLTGMLSALGWQSTYFFWLELIAFIPFFAALKQLKSKEISNFWKRFSNVFLATFLYKTIFLLITTNWFLPLSPTLLVIDDVMESLFLALLLTVTLGKRMPFIATISAFVLFEFFLQHFILLSPFYLLGYAWANKVAWIQYYRIIGMEGMTWLLLLVNFFLYEVFIEKKRSKMAFIVFGIFLLLTTYSWIDFYNNKNKKHTSFGKISIIHTEIIAKDTIYAHYQEDLALKINRVATPNSLVILPEVTYNSLGWIGGMVGNKTIHRLDSLRKANHQTFLLGAYLFSRVEKPGPQSRPYQDSNFYYNAHNVSLLLNDNINIKSKQIFIPFQEYIPNNFFLQQINHYISQIGDDQKVTILDENDDFFYKGHSFNTLLCYESLFPKFVLKKATDQDFLVIQANESWHKSKRCSELYLNTNRVAAIQTGLPVYRVSNYGYSAAIMPNGTMKTLYKTGKPFSNLQENLTDFKCFSLYKSIVYYSYFINLLLLLYFSFFLSNQKRNDSSLKQNKRK